MILFLIIIKIGVCINVFQIFIMLVSDLTDTKYQSQLDNIYNISNNAYKISNLFLHFINSYRVYY